ncbi:MAG: iron-sulfur cluster assembly scaffold protein [Thermoplasmatales archaeon]
MYNDEVMDRYQNPIKNGKMDKYDIKIDEASTTCGDKVILYIKTDGNRVEDMKWQGEGCILSVVSTDLFCENAVGKDIKSLKEVDDLKFIENFPVKISPGRINCVMLPLRAFRRGTKEK